MSEKPLPKSLLALFAKHPERFDEGWTEKDYSAGNDHPWSHWVYLKRGWAFPEKGSHIIHETTVKEVRQAWAEVMPCDCEDCR
jgi:hypothetical protein